MPYSHTEKLLSGLLGRLPFAKPFIKRVYQGINYLFFRKGITCETMHPLRSFGSESAESFFGYYDKSPVNEDERYILFHETSHPTREKPSAEKPVDIVLYDLARGAEAGRWQTPAYNWQQGARLMWISANKFVFNSYDEVADRYIARIVDTSDPDSERVVGYPVYDANPDIALSLSFERLNAIMPDYGYRAHSKYTDPGYSNDGIFKIDLHENNVELLLSLEEIIGLHHSKRMSAASHWVNHLMLSPGGAAFMFLHRWIRKGIKYDALFIAGTDGENVRCLADDGMVSHCCWQDEENIIAYMRDARMGDGYYGISIKDGGRVPLGKGQIDHIGDGHPSVSGQKMVFDTYPDRSRLKTLYIFDLGKKELNRVGTFYEPLKYHGQTRCDLHPGFSSSGKSIFIDSVHTGKRKLYQIEPLK
jgi:hypothetical protein